MAQLTQPTRTPSPRDQQIHAQVKISGCRQADVAREHNLTQSRVSRIVAQVERWRGTAAASHDQLSHTDYRRHERWLARQRWEEIYLRSLQELAASNRALTCERSGSRDGKEFQDTTRREQVANVQWLKTAMRAAEHLLKLSELEPVPPPRSNAERTAEEREQATHWLITARLAAECGGRVSRSGCVNAFVDQWLATLLGEQPQPDEAATVPRPLPLGLYRAKAQSTRQQPPNTPPNSSPATASQTNANRQSLSHMPHTPLANLPAAPPSSPTTENVTTPSPTIPCAPAVSSSSSAFPPASAQKNPPPMPSPLDHSHVARNQVDSLRIDPTHNAPYPADFDDSPSSRRPIKLPLGFFTR